jgi:lysozyme
MTSQDRQALIDQLLDHEGLRLRVYRDSLGIETIGVGRNLRDRGITKDEALYLLDNDIDTCIYDLATLSWFANLDPIRQRALVDLRFNLGPSKLRAFTRMLSALASFDYATASRELIASHWAEQVQPARRDRLLKMIRDGTDR